jgi:acetyl-CoA synthetase
MADDTSVRPAGEIDALLDENRTFAPSEAFRRAARAADPALYARAEADPEAFWAGFARSRAEHALPQVLTGSGRKRWFSGGHLNASVNRPTGTWRRRRATRPRSSGRASPGTGAPGLTSSCGAR